MNDNFYVTGCMMEKTDYGETQGAVLGIFDSIEDAENTCVDENCFVGPMMLGTEVVDMEEIWFPLANEKITELDMCKTELEALKDFFKETVESFYSDITNEECTEWMEEELKRVANELELFGIDKRSIL